MTEPQSTSNLLGRYELLHLLGQGGMGEVHLARSQGAAGFEKLCIVKTILPRQGKDPQFIERFLHEAKVLVQLSHSNIAQVYDMGEAGGQLFMSIEYVAGVDLARLEAHAWGEGAQIPVPVALFIGQRVAEALGYAHRKTGPDGAALGIVHRDVSPQNVMVSYEGEVKVIDFGLAKSAARSHQTQSATVLGKFGYLSPEQARAERVDFRSDIYSCGIVVWELLAGRPLFETGSTGEMLARMANPQIPLLNQVRPDVSEELARAVARALAVNPSDRYARADDFARALNERAIRDGASVSAEDVGSYVRERCATEFAEHRKLTSRLSSLSRPRSGASQIGLEATAIRRTPEPVSAGAVQGSAPQGGYAPAPMGTMPSPVGAPGGYAPTYAPGSAAPAPGAPGSGAPAQGYGPISGAPAPGYAPAAPLSGAPVPGYGYPPAAAVPGAPPPGYAPVSGPVPASSNNNRLALIAGLILALVAVLVLGVLSGMHLAAGHANAPAPSPVAQAPAAAQAASAPAAPQVATAPAAAQNPAPQTEVAQTESATAPATAETEEAAPARRHTHRKKAVPVKPTVVPASATVPAPVHVAPAAPPPPPPLVAAAHIAGAGPWKHVVLENKGDFRWHKCELRLPNNKHAFIDKLAPHDSESVNMMKFENDGPERDADLDWVNVRCDEGTAHVKFQDN